MGSDYDKAQETVDAALRGNSPSKGFNYGNKVRALLAMADDESLPEEAQEAYRAKAMRIMRDYQIAEEEALAVDPTTAYPISITIEYTPRDYTIAHYYHMMGQAIANHTGCRIFSAYTSNHGCKMTVVGYEGDVRYFEFLWTSAHLMYATRIDPVWDTQLPEAENIHRMRRAGIERRVIADKAWGQGAGNNAANRSKVQRIYLREAAKAGETAAASGLGFNTRNYRESYAEAFVATLTRRMREARDAADSVGALPTLHGRQDRVNEAFYEIFPNMRPSTTVAEPYVPANETCDACKKTKSGYARCHMYLKPRAWTKADEARFQARTSGASARAGQASGKHAAEGVVLRGTTPRSDRLDVSGKAIEG